MKLNFKIAASAVTASALMLSLIEYACAQGQMGARAQPIPPRRMERLGRGVVAIHQGGGKVFVGWRVLGTDPQDIAFNLYRTGGAGRPIKLNAEPLAGPTSFVDTGAKLGQSTSYFVRPVLGGKEQAAGKAFTLPANAPARPYLSIPLKTPPPVKTAEGEFPYAPNDASVGDLDGDGEYEIVLHQVGRGRDNSHGGQTNPPILQAYKLDGTLLWTINLGRNVREGAHYTQFLVYDFDGDGRAEMICKTSDGGVDGVGKVIGDPTANHVNEGGHVLKGPELITVFDGRTGAALATEKYLPARTNDHPETPDMAEYRALWGDTSGNRGERYLAAVAYLDGKLPSAVLCRGYYTRTALCAYDWRDGKLTQRWLFDTGAERRHPYAGQGNHNLSVADVDDDGRDEIVYGGCVIDDDGKGLFSTGYGHGDAIHVGDLDPSNPGLEMFRIQESFGDAGAHMVALKTGQTLWKKASLDRNAPGGKGQGPGRGLAADIDPRYPGAESWVLGAGIQGLWDARGNPIGEHAPTLSLPPGQITYGFDTPDSRPREVPTANFRIYWDGDGLDELLDGNQIVKWDWEKQTTRRLLLAEGCTSLNWTKANPSLSADILGDWREEVLFPTSDGKELRIFTTTIPTQRRLYTLMHDPVYRLGIAWQNVGYNQPPHLGFTIGPERKLAPRPNITLAADQKALP